VLMFDRPKIPRAQKLIYPESCGKLDASRTAAVAAIRLRRAREQAQWSDSGRDAEP